MQVERGGREKAGKRVNKRLRVRWRKTSKGGLEITEEERGSKENGWRLMTYSGEGNR